MKRKRALSLILSLVMTFSSFIGGLPVFAKEIEADTGAEEKLILHYDMKTTEESEGQIIMKDVSGSDVSYDGIFRNPENGQLIRNDEAGLVAFLGGSSTSNSGYIEIQKGVNGSDVLSGLDEVTVSVLANWENDGVNRWIYGLGTVTNDAANGNKYFFATPRHGTNNAMAAGISKAGWRNEALVTGSASLTSGTWQLVTIVFSETADTIILYVDGQRVAMGSAKGISLSEIIDHGSSFSGFIGKSIFLSDSYYKGKVGDFRIYNGALTDEEVAALNTEGTNMIVDMNRLMIDDAAYSLDMALYLADGDDSSDTITQDLTLPVTGKHGVNIAWSSSHPDVIANDGTVTRPDEEADNVQVQLTARLAYEGLSVQKTFMVTVLKSFADEQIVDLDVAKLAIYNQDNIKGHIRLATTGEHGSTITWTSSYPEIVMGTAQSTEDSTQLGRVIRPEADTQVTLTAIVTKGSAETERTFDLTVIKDPGELNYDAYFFAYFTGEYEGGEEVSFAIAEDPLKWRALNNGKSVLQSTLGEQGIRDPFIIRSPEGDKFYLLATDLKMGESTNFDQAQITGSHTIMIWESEDLVNWSEQRMVEVAPDNAGNTWAPEAFHDENTGNYVVFWASNIPNEDAWGEWNGGPRPHGQYNIMYYATTRDFYHFSEPKVYIDESFPTIDTTFIKHNETLYRFTKSEVNFKVYYEKADQIFYDGDNVDQELNGFQFEPVPGTRNGNQGLIGHAGNNEGQTVFKDLHEDKWYLFLDSWPYHVRYTTDLEDGSQLANNVLPASEYALPPGPRHGTVIPITQKEYNTLQAAYEVPGPAPSDEPVVHYTFDPEHVHGTTVEDVSGNGHNASLIGGAAVVSEDKVGPSGGALELDGTTGYVELPQNLIRDLNLEKMSISTWVKMDRNQANQRIFDFTSNTGRTVNRNTMYLSTQGDSGNMEFAIVTPFTEKFANESTPLSSTYKYGLRNPAPLTMDKWYHLVITIENYDAVLYVDGEEAIRSSTFNVEPRMLLETTMNYIGKSGKEGHNLFAGKLDDFRIYNRALSTEEVAELADEEILSPGEEPSNTELILHYDMNNIEGEIVKDNAGTFDGTWVNPQNSEWISSGQAGALRFNGGSTSSYIEIPEGVLDGLTDVTVSALVNWKGQRAAEWIFALGQDSNKYLFVTPRRNSGDGSARLGLGITSWRNEAAANATTGPLEANDWKLVTAVMSGTEETLKLYIDGVEVASDSTRGYTLSQINNDNGRSGYLGRSFYSADPYFGGMIADFRIFDGTLTVAEIEKLKADADESIATLEGLLLNYDADQLDYADFIGQNTSKDEIMSALSFPERGKFGTTITWESQNPEVITNEGRVNRPSYDEGNQAVVLVATLSDGRNSVTKEFTVTVVRELSEFEAVRWDTEALKVYNIDDVRGNLTLPTVGENGSVITWISENSDLVTPTGEVTRPAHGSGDARVQLTAKITLNDVTVTKAFVATIREMPVDEDYTGYLFSYFTGEGDANGEQIYMALSEGNSPLNWQEVNEGNPVLTSDLGEKGLRDPFIIRSPEGDKFYLIATDLKIHGNGDWNRAQTRGSRFIMVWESTDLINWSEQRMVEVSPPEAGNTWAPEVFYDHTTGEYIVFWASKLYDNEENRNSGASYQRMLYTKTRDFYTFTEPEVYMDYGYSVIDTTMIEHDGKIYRMTKDERSNTSSSPNGKFIFQEVGTSVLAPNFTMIKEGIGKGSIARGEGPTVFKSNTEDKWYMFIDEFGGRGYVPFETTNLGSGEWTMSTNYALPAHPRHGTVISVTQAEYDNLLSHIPRIKEPDTEIRVTGITLDQVDITLKKRQGMQLRATITPDEALNKDVIWSSSNEEVAVVDQTGTVKAIQEGSVYISVTTVEGQYIAICEVTVNGEEQDNIPPTTTHNIGQEATNGWYNSDVTVNFAAEDAESGVAATYYVLNDGEQQSGNSVTFREEGRHTVRYWSVDNAGNIEPVNSVEVFIDTTAPTITFSVEDGAIFTVEHEIEISCQVEDHLSGVASFICEETTILAYELGLGTHTFTAEATDVAGNSTHKIVEVVVIVSFDSLSALSREFVLEGDSNPDIANGLQAKLAAAQKADESGNTQARNNQLGAYINQVKAQSGKALTEEQADILIELAEALRN